MKTIKSIITLSFILIIIMLVVYFYSVTAHPTPKSDEKTRELMEANSFHIGILVAQNGASSHFAPSMEKAASAAAEVINASGGILGKKLSVHLGNTNSTAEGAAQSAASLINKNKAAVLIGTTQDNETIAVADVAQEKGVPFIYTANGEPKTCRKNDAKYPANVLWGMSLTSEMQLEPLLIFLADKVQNPQRAVRFAYLVSTAAAAAEQAEAAKKSAENLGFQTVDWELADNRLRDYYVEVRNITQSQADILYLSASENSMQLMISKLARLNVGRQMVVAGLHLMEEESMRILKPDSNGFFTVSDYSYALDNPANKQFLAAWKQVSSGTDAQPPTAMAAAVYSSMLLTQAAFNKAGSEDTNRFADALRNITIELPQGRLTVNPRNHLIDKPLYAVILKDGNYELVESLGEVSHPPLNGCPGIKEYSK